MSETFPRINSSGPAHMPAVSWFEFLLNENLLENHLSDESSDPTAAQLIVQFIQQADLHVANLYSGNGQPNNGFADWKPEASLVDNKQQIKENKKIQALRILALKVAAYLKWDLTFLENGVPLPIVQSLLSELLRVALGGDYELKKSAVDTMDSLSDEALFAIQLYHRWSLKSVVKDSFPAKVAKTGFFQGPGVVEQNIAALAANEAIVKSCKEQQAASLKVLERCAQCGRPLRVPTLHSLGMLNEQTQYVKHNWENGLEVPSEELRCQILCDLGAFYFYQENYSKAHEMFFEAKSLLETVKHPVFISLELTRLKGYVTACSTLQSVAQEISGQLSLIEQAEASKRQFFKGITEVLMEDNLRQELPMEYRLDVEEEFIKKKPREKAVIFQLKICNIIRRVLEGRAVLSDLSDDLSKKTANVEFLMKVLRHAMSGASHGQRSNLKCFVWHILQTLPRDSDFSDTLLKSDLRSYFDEDEYSEFSSYEEDDFTFMDDNSYTVGSRSPRSSVSRESSRVMGGDLERQLICAYDPNLIRHLVKELSYKLGRQASNLLTLNDKWKLPREIHQGLEPLTPGVDKNYIYILIAKARHCMDLRIFERSRQLLSKADSLLTQDSTYKLSKHIKWQVVLADLQEFFLTGTFPEGTTQQDVAKKAKTCITSLRLDQDIQPSPEVLEHCIAFLLNIQDWAYMCNLENTRNVYIEFGRLISCTCKDLPNIKNARKAARDLWEADDTTVLNQIDRDLVCLEYISNYPWQMEQGDTEPRPTSSKPERKDKENNALIKFKCDGKTAILNCTRLQGNIEERNEVTAFWGKKSYKAEILALGTTSTLQEKQRNVPQVTDPVHHADKQNTMSNSSTAASRSGSTDGINCGTDRVQQLEKKIENMAERLSSVEEGLHIKMDLLAQQQGQILNQLSSLYNLVDMRKKASQAAVKHPFPQNPFHNQTPLPVHSEPALTFPSTLPLTVPSTPPLPSLSTPPLPSLSTPPLPSLSTPPLPSPSTSPLASPTTSPLLSLSTSPLSFNATQTLLPQPTQVLPSTSLQHLTQPTQVLPSTSLQHLTQPMHILPSQPMHIMPTRPTQHLSQPTQPLPLPPSLAHSGQLSSPQLNMDSRSHMEYRNPLQILDTNREDFLVPKEALVDVGNLGHNPIYLEKRRYDIARSKNSPILFLKKLMSELFTPVELTFGNEAGEGSIVLKDGRTIKLAALDQRKMLSIKRAVKLEFPENTINLHSFIGEKIRKVRYQYRREHGI